MRLMLFLNKARKYTFFLKKGMGGIYLMQGGRLLKFVYFIFINYTQEKKKLPATTTFRCSFK